jgi:aspartate-semialdehyde dehydrogenase
MVLALNPLHRVYGIRRVVVSTYQSVTGTGVKAVRQLEDERQGIQGEKHITMSLIKTAYPSVMYLLPTDTQKRR